MSGVGARGGGVVLLPRPPHGPAFTGTADQTVPSTILVYSPTAHWSYSPLVLQPTLVLRFHVYSHWSYSPLVLQPIGPTAHWSYSPLVLQPTGPTAHWSYSPLVLQPTGPTIRHLQYSVLFQYYLNMKMYLIHMKLIKLGIQGIGRSEKYRNL